jgi:hypothetical protein
MVHGSVSSVGSRAASLQAGSKRIRGSKCLIESFITPLFHSLEPWFRANCCQVGTVGREPIKPAAMPTIQVEKFTCFTLI